MNLLVDTHAMLWFAAGDERISPVARAAIENGANTCYISIASWWEIAIKCSLGKMALDVPLQDFIDERIDEGFRVLTIDTKHLPILTALPFHHRDPFDRLLISQAMSEAMPICTGDERFADYDVRILW